jgi:glycosyltransferase involved in cell wall biosynthesis
LTGRSTRLAHGIARTLSSRADVIVYNSVHARQTHADAGFVDDRALVIRNGVPSLDGGDRAAARVAVGVPLDAFVVGHVARWHPVKDHATMLGAFAMLARTTPKARLLLVGEGMEPSNSALLALIARQGLDGFVYLLGHHRSMETIYASMDVACLSSRSEAFPNVLAEAMSMGVPCVSTAVGDVAGLVGDTGRLVQPGDAEGLAQALLELVQMEPQDRKALGAAAKARVLKDYGIDAVAQDYVRLYRQLEAA